MTNVLPFQVTNLCLRCDGKMVYAEEGKVIHCPRCGYRYRFATFPTLTGQYWNWPEWLGEQPEEMRANELRRRYREAYPKIAKAWKEISDEQQANRSRSTSGRTASSQGN